MVILVASSSSLKGLLLDAWCCSMSVNSPTQSTMVGSWSMIYCIEKPGSSRWIYMISISSMSRLGELWHTECGPPLLPGCSLHSQQIIYASQRCCEFGQLVVLFETAIGYFVSRVRIQDDHHWYLNGIRVDIEHGRQVVFFGE